MTKDSGPLHLKYRPRSLDEFLWNDSVVESLQSLLAREPEDRPRAFLFQGPSGCGKTTLARILKEEFGCSDTDFTELNVANVRGIDTIRDIVSNCRFAPMAGLCRIYLLDEAHKLTTDAQNALLKLLEDTPKHVYFFLCTTEPEKLIKTIRTRCTTYQVTSMPKRVIVSLLSSVCEKERVSLPKQVLQRIAEVCEGSPRQALVILDSVIDIEDDDELVKAIEDLRVKRSGVIELCRALLDGKRWNTVSSILNTLDDEPENVRYAVLGYMSSVLLKGENDRAASIIANFSDSYMYVGKAGLVLSCYVSCKETQL